MMKIAIVLTHISVQRILQVNKVEENSVKEIIQLRKIEKANVTSTVLHVINPMEAPVTSA